MIRHCNRWWHLQHSATTLKSLLLLALLAGAHAPRALAQDALVPDLVTSSILTQGAATPSTASITAQPPCMPLEPGSARASTDESDNKNGISVIRICYADEKLHIRATFDSSVLSAYELDESGKMLQSITIWVRNSDILGPGNPGGTLYASRTMNDDTVIKLVQIWHVEWSDNKPQLFLIAIGVVGNSGNDYTIKFGVDGKPRADTPAELRDMPAGWLSPRDLGTVPMPADFPSGH